MSAWPPILSSDIMPHAAGPRVSRRPLPLQHWTVVGATSMEHACTVRSTVRRETEPAATEPACAISRETPGSATRGRAGEPRRGLGAATPLMSCQLLSSANVRLTTGVLSPCVTCPALWPTLRREQRAGRARARARVSPFHFRSIARCVTSRPRLPLG